MIFHRTVVAHDILVLCTGNLCRSQYVAARLAAALPHLEIGSAGTGALVGEQPPAVISELLARQGVTTDLPPARQVTRRDVRGARLILTATAMQRVQAARMASGGEQRSFTLKELARVLSNGRPSVGIDGALAVAVEAFSRSDGHDYDDDLVDPYEQSIQVFETMAADAEAALAVLIPTLDEGGAAHADPAR